MQATTEQFVEVQAASLIGPALDWAVAKAVGVPAHLDPQQGLVVGNAFCWRHLRPSTDWGQGGQLVDQYDIQFARQRAEDGGQFVASIERPHAVATGPNRLIAAARAVVKALLGSTVSVPAILIQGSH
jgi:hypothetical protein